jgi:uncharacterized protein DUF5818
MKSVVKWSLCAGISLVLMALTARRLEQEAEIEGPADTPPTQPPPVGEQSPPALPRAPAKPIVAPTVTFSGTVVRNGPRFALRETAGALYLLDSAGRAWHFEGEDVRVTGKLDLDTRLLYVDAIESSVL